MAKGKFGTVINCIDGRTQLPVNEWMTKEFGLDFVDTITEPGPDKMLAENDETTVPSIRKRVAISVEKHGSDIVVVVGHYDCAGNPVHKDEHIRQVHKAIDLIDGWNLPVKVIGVWVDENWKVETID
jgi:hypothetical protein